MLKIDRSIAPAIQQIEKTRLQEPQIHKLENDVPVYVFQSKIQPVVKLHILVDAGKFYQRKPLLAFLTSKMLREGSANKDAEVFAEALDFYGANIKTHSGMDVAGISLSFLKKHSSKILPLLSELIEKPGFREDDLQILKTNEKQRFLVDQTKNDFIADRHFNALVFGEKHPYGIQFKAEDFEQIEIEDIQYHYNEFYRWGSSKIIVAGDVDQTVLDEINAVFGQFEVEEKPLSKPKIEAFQNQKLRYSIKDAQQAALRIGCRSLDKKHPDYMALSFVNTLLGAHFSSRLMSNIREDKGYTYGIYSMINNYRELSSWEISTEVGVQVADAAIDEVYKEMSRLIEEPVPEKEMYLVKNYLQGRLLSGLDGAFKQAAYYKMLLTFGLNYGYIYKLIDTIQSIQPEDVMQIAQKYLRPQDMTELVVE